MGCHVSLRRLDLFGLIFVVILRYKSVGRVRFGFCRR